LIYNPNQTKAEPKTKPIFKVIRPSNSGSGGSRKSSLSHDGSSGGRLDQNFLSDIAKSSDQMNLFSSGNDFHMHHDDLISS
jgi:hypothetical protein